VKIIFMGTPEFAVPALNALNKNNYDIPLVITQPDRPKGRGRKLTPPPVKETALNFGYEVAQPESINSDSFLDRISNLHPDLFVVVAFGSILSKKALSIPKSGTVNIHPSLLPKYRGPAPIQWAIINGDTETGVSTMFLGEKVDDGDILLTSKIRIEPEDNAETLHNRLADAGADLLIKTLQNLENKTITPVPQDHTQATLAPLLKKEDGLINWKLPAKKIESLIRGVSIWPGAYTFYKDKRLKIFKAEVIETKASEPPGTVIKGFPDELPVATGKEILSILEIQSPSSGKRLLIKDFLRGFKMPAGEMFGH